MKKGLDTASKEAGAYALSERHQSLVYLQHGAV
jgi:hypothetical protein